MLTYLLTLLLSANIAHAATALTTKAELDAALAKHRPMVVMFHAAWCGWCKKEEPEYAKAEKAFDGKVDFYVVDIDKVETHGFIIGGIPAFVAGKTKGDILRNDHLVEGYMTAEQLIAYIKKYTQ